MYSFWRACALALLDFSIAHYTHSVKHFFGSPCGLPIWDSDPVRPACLVDYLTHRLAAAAQQHEQLYPALVAARCHTRGAARMPCDLVNLRGRWTVRPFPAVRVGRCSFVVAISYHTIRIVSTPFSKKFQGAQKARRSRQARPHPRARRSDTIVPSRPKRYADGQPRAEHSGKVCKL